MFVRHLQLLTCAVTIISAATIWNGNFNAYSTSSDLDKWSFGSRTGQWQTYIYGNQPSPIWKASSFINLSPSYKNPADGQSAQGARVLLNDSSSWNDVGKKRTELIPEFTGLTSPQTGTRYYSWSMKQGTTEQLDATANHQLVFFEAHFADIQFGAGNCGANLCFVQNYQDPVWKTPFTADVWHNFVLMVDWTGSNVALYYSTGGDQLSVVVPSRPASIGGNNGTEWHLGHLRVGIQGEGPISTQYLYYSGAMMTDALTQIQTGTYTAPTNPTSSPTSQQTSQQQTSQQTSQPTQQTSQQQTSQQTSQPTQQPSTTGTCVEGCIAQCGSSGVQSCDCSSGTPKVVCQGGGSGTGTGTNPNDCNHLGYCSDICGSGNVKSCTCVGAQLVPECASASMIGSSILAILALSYVLSEM